jgi:hypothetical protein
MLMKDSKNEYHFIIEGIKDGVFKFHYGCKRCKEKK